MSQPSLASQSRGDVPTQKQKMNVYTVMLIISFICIVTACLLLYFELKRWGNFPYWNTSEARPNVAWLSPSLDSGAAFTQRIA